MLNVKDFVDLGTVCPSQWEGRTEDDKYVFIRYRYGWVSVWVDNSMVHGVEHGDARDGVMDEVTLRTVLNGVVDW